MDVSPTWAEREAAEREADLAWAAFVALGDPALLARLSGGRLDAPAIARAAGAMASAAASLTADARLEVACAVTRDEVVAALVGLGIQPRRSA